MIDSAKRLVSGTRLEPWARGLWRLLGGGKGGDARGPLYDRQTVEIMRRVLEKDSSCIDVGAFKGDLLAAMVSIAPQGAHCAFEPLPHMASELGRRFPQVKVFEAALSDVAGRRDFRRVLENEAYSGFTRRPYDSYEERIEVISVEVMRLDDAIPTGFQPRFVKVDVEGNESQVFRGAVETLARFRPYIVYESGWDPEGSFDVLSHAGLQLSILGDWLKGSPSLTREQFLDEALSGRHFYFLAHPAS